MMGFGREEVDHGTTGERVAGSEDAESVMGGLAWGERLDLPVEKLCADAPLGPFPF
jgi:hypothetical protein